MYYGLENPSRILYNSLSFACNSSTLNQWLSLNIEKGENCIKIFHYEYHKHFDSRYLITS